MKLQIGVKVLIKNKDARYLLLQRSEPLPDGTGIKWDIPGGRIEPAESLHQALEREVHEETVFHVSSMPQLLAAQDIFFPNIGVHVVRLTYLMQSSGAVRLGGEHQKYDWEAAKQAMTLNTDPYLREVLQALVGPA